MAKKWREFEKLVSRIEKLLSPQGAVITSPDKIKDKITGQDREVDVSIRYPIGSINVLITIECRDRKATPDDTWIEQLATKKQKIGASHTIAVSSTGFTKPAITSAKTLGIELRLISNITNEDILSWIDRIKFINQVGKVSFEGIKIKFFGDNENLQLSPSVLKAIEKDKLQARVFYIEPKKQWGDIAGLLDYFVRIYAASIYMGEKLETSNSTILRPGEAAEFSLHPEYLLLFDGVPVNSDGLGQSKTFTFRLNNGVLVETVEGPKYAKEVVFELVLLIETQEIPITRKVQYASEDEIVSNVVETELELFKFDEKKEIIVSYTVPIDEDGPVAMIVTEKSDELGETSN